MYSTKIKSIKKIGEIDTYDLNTPEVGNFILANGILSHNSGKSYSCLSTGEKWYKYRFKEDYPIENVCFSLGEVAKRINVLQKEDKLRKGELFILEEAGANFSNMDFQNKLSKMFNYILQSFRSMNLILLITLPVLTMMNKGARQLIHGNFVTSGINYELEVTSVKPYMHQLSQLSGKSYWKYPKVFINKKTVKLQRLKFLMPSKDLIIRYEKQKSRFVIGLTDSFLAEAEQADRENLLKMARKGLTNHEFEILKLLRQGLTRKKIMEHLGIAPNTLSHHLVSMERKGYEIKDILRKNQEDEESNPRNHENNDTPNLTL